MCGQVIVSGTPTPQPMPDPAAGQTGPIIPDQDLAIQLPEVHALLQGEGASALVRDSSAPTLPTRKGPRTAVQLEWGAAQGRLRRSLGRPVDVGRV
jgi:hypothetical protein